MAGILSVASRRNLWRACYHLSREYWTFPMAIDLDLVVGSLVLEDESLL